MADQDNTARVRRTPAEVVVAAGAFRLAAAIRAAAALDPAAMKSLVERALTGGYDRTIAELQELLRAASFAAVDAHLVQDPFWIVAGRRTAS